MLGMSQNYIAKRLSDEAAFTIRTRTELSSLYDRLPSPQEANRQRALKSSRSSSLNNVPVHLYARKDQRACCKGLASDNSQDLLTIAEGNRRT